MAPNPSPERWKRLDQLFQHAADLPGPERAALLASLTGADAELRDELAALLASDNETTDFIQAPLREAAGHMAASQTTLAPGTQIGHYQIVSLVGSGGMGRVYLAHDTKLGRKVAFKTLAVNALYDERALRRFEQEARTASALNHPNILTIYEIDQLDGIHFIVSEFVDGPNLRERLRAGRIAPKEAVDIAAQIAAALNAAHSVGVTHRDIKPENVMVRTDGLVKVVDFGIAKLTEPPSGESPVLPKPSSLTLTTQPGMVIGTARYMSPEQVRGLALDGRSDIFSLGAVLYEMVSGHAPFEGATQSDVVAEILKTDPKPLAQVGPSVPAGLDRIVSTAMNKDRDARYQSAREMSAALQSLQKQMELGTAGHTSAKVPFWRYRWARANALALLIMAAVGYFFWHQQTRLPTGPRTVAILPFRNIRQDPATEFLGFSLADAVITKLGYVSSLTIRPSSSIEQYRNKAIDPRRVGAELNVNTILTGSFLKDGDNLRINAQLVDLRPMRIIWDDTIDIQYQNLLTVQDRVSQKIISGLELSLAPAEGARLNADHAISQSAYERYLRGVNDYASDDFDHAIEELEQSAAMEPNYALTWAHLGRAYTTNAGLQFGGREEYRKAQTAYEKALALNPDLIEAKIYEANLLTDTGRAEQAIPLLRAALAANPNVAEAHWELGYAYRYGGMLPESVTECETARRLDPNVKINSSALNTYFYLGEYDKFLASLPNTDSAYILFYRGLGEYYKGDDSTAESHFDRAFELNPALPQAEIGKALADGCRHDPAAGRKLLHEAEDRARDRGVTDGEGIYKIAQGYAVLGDSDSALRVLRMSIDAGFFPYSYFQSDPLLNNIRRRPEFPALMDGARRRSEEFRTKFGR
jgi:serine/threonine protein kinase/tetratricopeptide (TPR) repeat protein